MKKLQKNSLLFVYLLVLPVTVWSQQSEDEILELSPFTIESSDNDGYLAQSTLAGSRLRTETRDLGGSISILTKEFMNDLGATDGESLLQNVGNVEVGGVLGNFSSVNTDRISTEGAKVNPQRAQRVRGLDSAILTRDYFTTDIPFDSYNTTRVTVNRGPNSILFGLGSPGGIINSSTNRAQIGSEFGNISVRVDHTGGHRETLDVNKTVIQDRLAIRVGLLNEKIKFRQEPAFEDDNRFFVAWDAVLFKNENSSWLGKTIFRGSYENGEILRNPPDVVPPADGVTPWFKGIGTQEDLNRILRTPGVDFSQIGNEVVTREQVLSAISSGLATVPAGMTAEEFAAIEGQFVPKTTTDRFKRGIGEQFGDPTDGGINSAPVSPAFWAQVALFYDSINATEPGFNDPALAGIQGFQGRANRNGFPTQEIWWAAPLRSAIDLVSWLPPGFEIITLKNRDIFDYHKNLFSGTSNRVVTDFDIQQFILEQQLFDGNAGFEIAWDKQSQSREAFVPVSDFRDKTIYIDVSENHPFGDQNWDGEPDSFYNENLGRPAANIWDLNFDQSTAEQETFRATVFGSFDFKDRFDNKLGKILGSHTITGLYEDRVNETWSKRTSGAWWADSGKWPGDTDIQRGLSNSGRRIVRSMIYLGDDARGFNSPSDVHIDGGINIRFPQVGDQYGVYYFDNDSSLDTYVTNNWRIIEHIGNMDISRRELESSAFSLQSRLFDNHIIGMWATRHDEETVFQRLQHNTNFGDPSQPGVIPQRLDLPGINEIDGNFNEGLLVYDETPIVSEGDTDTWSVIGRYPEVLLGDLPWGIDLSGHYYEAESFRPAGNSNNILNQPLGSPFGTTKEYGFTIELLDRRLAIRYNEYETSSTNVRTGNMNGQLGAIAGRFDFFLTRVAQSQNSPAENLFPDGWDPDPNLRTGDALLTPDTNPNNVARVSGTDADLGGFASYEEYYDAIFNAIPPELQAARNFRKTILQNGEVDFESDPIVGLNSTQDLVATGKEIDIVGQVTDNLSVQLNVAQQNTVTANTGPVAIPLAFKIQELLSRPLPNSPGGWALTDLRDSPALGDATTIGSRYDVVIREMQIQQGRDNTVSQEQREWRVNLTARYDFLEGFLKGFQIGGTLRYQDELAGGYRNRVDEFGNVLPDIANPWFGPSELNGDLFLRYGRKLTDKIDWQIQFNARNLYRDHGAKDIPVTFSPDGSIGITRIPVEQQYFITNTFSF